LSNPSKGFDGGDGCWGEAMVMVKGQRSILMRSILIFDFDCIESEAQRKGLVCIVSTAVLTYKFEF
jgi:hypothetical protein